jgi:hypothetical protein
MRRPSIFPALMLPGLALGGGSDFVLWIPAQ